MATLSRDKPRLAKSDAERTKKQGKRPSLALIALNFSSATLTKTDRYFVPTVSRIAHANYALAIFCEFEVSDIVRSDSLNGPSQPIAELLRPKFLTNSFGVVVAAELPQLGLSRVSRFVDEAEADFRERVHLELVRAHYNWTGPFYELLDTSTLTACRTAIVAALTTRIPDQDKKIHDSGEFYFLSD